MRVPHRKSQDAKRLTEDTGPFPITAPGLERMKRELEDLEKRQRPQAVHDVTEGVQRGDLSENAEYQEAKARLARIDGRMFSLKERMKRAIVIQGGNSSSVELGSMVVVEVNGKEHSYHIVGPHESNPSQGRISHISPLGSALLHHSSGDSVTVTTPNGTVVYRIIDVK